MGLFGNRSKKQQAEDIIKISFEGEEPLFTIDYKPEYDDILQCMEIVEANTDKKRTYFAILIFVVFAALGLPTFFQRNIWFGIFAVIIVAYVLFTQLFGPKLSRESAARKAADTMKTCKLLIFKGGVQINDGQNTYNIPYRIMLMYESETLFVLLLGAAKILAFPKRFFDDKTHLVREIFHVNLGVGRRYFEVDAKGKIKP